MSRLIILSITFPIQELVTSLPQLSTEAHKFIQERVSNQLDTDARKLLQFLSVIRKSFLISAIDHLTEDVVSKFDQLTKKFLVTKVSKSSSYYEIHDLVKEFELSRLPPDDRIAAHINAAKYYTNLEKRTFSDGAELVGHLIEGKKYKVAEKVSTNLLGSALHAGLFDFAVDFSNQLIEEKAFEEWGEIYFLRGRAFRLKGEINNALESYKTVSQKTNDDYMREAAQIEESSMLFLSERDADKAEATKILNKLAASDNSKIRIQALTSLGYVNIKHKGTRKKGLAQLQDALNLAETEGLHRNIMQICHGLGDAYLQNNQMKKALGYLERARTMREDVSAEYGEIDLEADYHLFKSLEDVYRNLRRYDDAASAGSICVHIDRKHNFRDRLALSLYNLGEELCVLRDYKAAQQVLSESLDLVRTQNLGSTAKQLTTELLIVANWYLNQFEYAIELILEYILAYMNEDGFAGKHIIMQENDISFPEGVERPQFVNMGGNMLHLLILPQKFSYQDVKQWHENVLIRRPELTPAYNPVFLQNKTDE